MDLRQLRYFVAIAEEMHFGRAAERLHVVQPALSRSLSLLEKELGFKLLERRPISFTPPGKVLYDEVRPHLGGIDKAVAHATRVSRGESGKIEIGYLYGALSDMLLPILRTYLQRVPDMSFNLVEMGSGTQLEQLREGLLDVCFMRPAEHEDLIEFEPIRRDRFVLALPSNHRFAHREIVELSDLGSDTFIVMSRHASRAVHDLLFSLFRQHGISPDVIEGGGPSVLNLVALGLAVAVIPETNRNLGIDGIVFRELGGPPIELEMAMAYRKNESSPAVDRFLEVVREVRRMPPKTRAATN